jgi:hypothetical protein
MKLGGMYIMAPEPISTVYFINPSDQSVSIRLSPVFVDRQRLGRQVPVATKNCWRRRFYEVRVVSKEHRRVILPRTFCYWYQLATSFKEEWIEGAPNNTFHTPASQWPWTYHLFKLMHQNECICLSMWRTNTLRQNSPISG